MADVKPIISIDHVSMRFNLAKERHESLKEYFVALLHGGIRFDEFFALDDVTFDIMPVKSNFRRVQAQRGQGDRQRHHRPADRVGRGL